MPRRNARLQSQKDETPAAGVNTAAGAKRKRDEASWYNTAASGKRKRDEASDKPNRRRLEKLKKNPSSVEKDQR